MTFSLDARAAHWGDRTAVVDVSESRRYEEAETIDRDRYSYAELAAIAERFAASLSDRGVDAGDAVCVVSRNRVRVLALFFACRRLGATFAPLSHRLTPKTVSRPLERLEPAIVVTESAQRDLTREVQHAKTVAFDELDDDVDTDTEFDADAGFDAATDLESQSTDGTPLVTLHDDPGGTDSDRGADPDPDAAVDFSERAVEANCRAVATTWGLGRADCTPLLLPLSAPDGLLRTALPALYSGGTLLLDRAFDPGDTLEAIRREPVTGLVGRRAELRDLAANDDDDALEALEWVVGEVPVSEEVRNAFLERGVPVAGAYGCPACPTALAQPVGGEIGADTEVETGSTAGAATETDTEPGDGGAGHPLFDCRVRLVADDSVVEGTGEGRLEVAGPMVAGSAIGSDGAGTATDWVATGDRFRRDEDGRYYPVDLEDDVAGAVDES